MCSFVLSVGGEEVGDGVIGMDSFSNARVSVVVSCEREPIDSSFTWDYVSIFKYVFFSPFSAYLF